MLAPCVFPFCHGYIFLQAYDQHLNMILGDVEEVVTTVEIDDETYEEIVRVSYNFILLLLTCSINGLLTPSCVFPTSQNVL